MNSALVAGVVARWCEPSADFSHGLDPRSSDCGLLLGLYGGLVKAARHNWQNAGRVLVDRTDIRILFDSYRIDLPIRPLDQCCRDLDLFVRESIFPDWEEKYALEADLKDDIERHAERVALVDNWINLVAQEIFGGDEYGYHAQVLLFFLCPSMPFCPKSTVSKHSADVGFSALESTIPEPVKAFVGGLGVWESGVARNVLYRTDWWARRMTWAGAV